MKGQIIILLAIFITDLFPISPSNLLTQINVRTVILIQESELDVFLNRALLNGMMKEQIGQIARQKAVLQRVRDFGQLMERNNNEANEELRKILKTKNIIIPENIENKHQKEINRLNKRTGSKFDNLFIKSVIETYKKDIIRFSEVYTNVTDHDLKVWIESTIKMMETHLQKAVEIEQILSD